MALKLHRFGDLMKYYWNDLMTTCLVVVVLVVLVVVGQH